MFYNLCYGGGQAFLASAGFLGWAGLILYGILRLGIVIGIVLLLVWVIRYATQRPVTPNGQQAPVEILRSRYAHGEISREQYEYMKRDIE